MPLPYAFVTLKAGSAARAMLALRPRERGTLPAQHDAAPYGLRQVAVTEKAASCLERIAHDEHELNLDGYTWLSDSLIRMSSWMRLRHFGLAGTAAGPLARHHNPLLEELATPHAPWLRALHCPGEALRLQRAAAAKGLGRLHSCWSVCEPELWIVLMAGDRPHGGVDQLLRGRADCELHPRVEQVRDHRRCGHCGSPPVVVDGTNEKATDPRSSVPWPGVSPSFELHGRTPGIRTCEDGGVALTAHVDRGPEGGRRRRRHGDARQVLVDHLLPPPFSRAGRDFPSRSHTT